MAKVYCVVIEHDSDQDMSWLQQDHYKPGHPDYSPIYLTGDQDMSWLQQDHYKPGHPDYSPIYLTEEDMKAKRNPVDPEWYCDPDNHVMLAMITYAEPTDDDEPEVLDSLGGIDFLRDSDEWRTGTFYRVSQIRNAPYLQELARELGLEE